MEFDESHKVKHWLLEDREEARAFIDFLETERERHDKERRYSGAMVRLWQSQVLRHEEDIEGIDISTKDVGQRFEL